MAFRLAISNSLNFACKFFFFCVDLELLNLKFFDDFVTFLGLLVAENFVVDFTCED